MEAEGDLTGAWLPDDCADWCDQVKKLVIRGGNIKKMEGTFSTWDSLESVVLPEGIESMESISFCFCSKLRKVVLPSSLKTIGMGAFQSCKELESIVLPEGLETISDMAFSNCPKLARIEIPASVKEIGSGVFTETAWLEAQRALGDMVVVNDILVAYLGEEEEVEISEDSGIRCIAGSVFGYNTALRKVVMDDTVEEMGKGVFNGCFSLTSVRLSSNLKELPEQAFGNCTSLEEIVLPEGIERIGRYAFRECKSLRAISIPESVTCIEEEVFTGTALYNEQAAEGDYIVLKDFLIKCLIDEHEIVIPEDLGIRRIADFAFERKERLTKVTIPEGIVSLGECCFFFCRNLETIEFPESLTEIGWGAMAATKWMENLNEAGGPYVVNGIDISY